MEKKELAVIGTGEVPTGWFPERSAMDAACDVSKQAIIDAGINKDEIEGVIIVTPLGTERIACHLAFSRLVEEIGLKGCRFNTLVNSGGSTTMAALLAARGMIDSGTAKTVLVVHSQNFSSVPPAKLIAWFQENAGQYEEWELCYGMSYNALVGMAAQRYMYETGTKPEHIAAVCVSLRKWAALHPSARFRKPMTIEDVLKSKMIATPLHALECNALSDGASAFIVTDEQRAKSIIKTPVYVVSEGHGGVTHFSPIQKPDKDLTRWGFDRAGKEALQKAGIGLKDIDIVQIYMAYPHFHLMLLEELGFCKRGEAGAFVLEGHTWPGGDLPMTTTGDALSQGHTGTGVGMAVFVESVRQLMGKCGERQVKDATFVMESSCGGGYMDSHVTILGKEMPS